MHILTAKNLNKTFHKNVALHNVDLEIPKQSIFGLLGPNGAGKSTFIRIVNQIINADSGQIQINGENLAPKHIGTIGYLPEERGLYKKMKVGDQLLYLAQLKGLSKKEAVQKIKVWLERFEASDWLNKKIEDLSKGMQQKVQFVSTVMHEPELIILDEPFSGFDPINANLIKDEILSLREKGSTIIFSTHRMESVEEMCDYIALINKSEKILDGEKSKIKNDFKSNQYSLVHRGNGISSNDIFNLESKKELGEGLVQSNLKLISGTSSNQLLQELINQKVDIVSFQEEIPSINDIFIQLVKGDKQNIPTS
ncbi:ABC transporter ATP-binding protein [Marivirga tractuosa]|uniref:ABC transporter related protein n=1 Tax=Marivirga tractuosa (strain ATCC 23168 / DSM 4126 / NBRC 15989 / NCIMB 1408 / VKM B-1430 / H-43) TaxID=643867 RepID=E4TME5_MARTH|nr:ATP-binding cassette domain-containing protein [Marivirga tractuosa]ADR22404.1 ABC transporter related protein [Marivirga tractuosa DSM 4126]BDD16925.1 ABC transporter ATP-binding protein [Marivirga tractuosa]